MNEKNRVFNALLTTKGRKTGKEHSVWLRAVMYNDKVYFSRHRSDGDWFQNAIASPDVKVNFNNKEILGKADVVSNDDLAKKISELKYPGEEKAKDNRVVLEVTLYE